MSRDRNAARENGAVWDRFAICEGFNLYQMHWHKNGLTARDLDADRPEDARPICTQLFDMQFRAGPSAQFIESCSLEAFEVYTALVLRWEPEYARSGLRADYRRRYGDDWEQHAPPEIL